MTVPRSFPSIDELTRSVQDSYSNVPRPVIVDEARRTVAAMRSEAASGGRESVELRLRDALSDPDLPPMDRETFTAIVDLLRAVRQDSRGSLLPRNILVFNERSAGLRTSGSRRV